MFQPSIEDAPASTVPAEQTAAEPTPRYEDVRHLLYGTLASIQSTIHFLHKRGYADPNDWSDPMPTGKANQWMSTLTKRVKVE